MFWWHFFKAPYSYFCTSLAHRTIVFKSPGSYLIFCPQVSFEGSFYSRMAVIFCWVSLEVLSLFLSLWAQATLATKLKRFSENLHDILFFLGIVAFIHHKDIKVYDIITYVLISVEGPGWSALAVWLLFKGGSYFQIMPWVCGPHSRAVLFSGRLLNATLVDKQMGASDFYLKKDSARSSQHSWIINQDGRGIKMNVNFLPLLQCGKRPYFGNGNSLPPCVCVSVTLDALHSPHTKAGNARNRPWKSATQSRQNK